MRLTLIRHTAVNCVKGICYGQSDVGLADSFEDEKAVIQQKLEGVVFDRIYCSPLLRCRKLAESLFPLSSIIFDDRLKELHFGDWENQLWDQIFQSGTGKKWFTDYFHQPCPGGESYPDLVSRIQSFFEEVSIESATRRICIVSHGGPIKIIRALAEKRDIETVFNSFNPAYGEIIEIP